MQQRRPIKKKKPRIRILWYYPITLCVVGLGVLVYALTYQGGGANALLDPAYLATLNSKTAATDGALDAAPDDMVLDPDATPAPTPEATPAAPAAPSTSGRLLPYLQNGLYGYKNTKGEVVLAPRYLRAHEFGEGSYTFAAVEQSGSLRYGILTRDGNWLVAPQFEEVRPYSEGKAAVKMEDKWGYIDTTGRLVIACEYREVGDFHGGRAPVRPNSTFGYIDPDGVMAISTQFDEAGDFFSDLAFVAQNGKRYIINKVGKKITTLGGIRGTAYADGLAAIKNEDGTYSYFNTSRRRAFSEQYADARNFSDGMAAVKQEELWGYINRGGTLAIQPSFVDAKGFSESFAAVQNTTGKWGYINKSGAVKIDFLYDEAEPFYLGVALVRQGSTQGFIDTKGNFIAL